MTCSTHCLKDENCNAFIVKDQGFCVPIEKTSELVKTSRQNQKASKIWSKEAALEPLTLVPHFLIIGQTTVEDYSLDPVKSPPITTYPDWPFSGCHRPYLFDEQTLAQVPKPQQLWWLSYVCACRHTFTHAHMHTGTSTQAHKHAGT